MSKKIGRNDPCPCKSGLKYKYCCIGNDLRQVSVPINNTCDCGGKLSLDFTNDILNAVATADLPLKNFCKDNDLYFFGMAVTIGEAEHLQEQLKNKELTKEAILNTFKKNFSKEIILGVLESACSELELFKQREVILKDAFEAHFNSKYTLSIPTLFPQLEGLLREIGNLKNSDTIKPTIPIDIWDERLLFPVTDDAKFYNGFIQKLFEGSKDNETFNRNPILHGVKIDYYSEEHSMLIMLSILEIRMFKWWLSNTKKFTEQYRITVRPE